SISRESLAGLPDCLWFWALALDTCCFHTVAAAESAVVGLDVDEYRELAADLRGFCLSASGDGSTVGPRLAGCHAGCCHGAPAGDTVGFAADQLSMHS